MGTCALPNIRDVLLNFNVPHVGSEHKHGRPGWVQVDCPWCGPRSGSFHLGISLSSGASSCWRCGRHDTALVIATITGGNVGAIRHHLADATHEAPPVQKTGCLTLPGGRGALLPGHCHYLATRGLDPATMAALWGVEGIGQAAPRRFQWRLFIPIYSHGEIVSWTTRSIRPKGGGLRYLSASLEEEAVPHKRILYGADYARHAIIIHEGPIDVWATGPGAVATCGTAYTEAQLLAMSRYAVRVVCYDAEPTAQARARGLADALCVYPGVTVNVLLETGKDAAEADPAEVAALRHRFLE